MRTVSVTLGGQAYEIRELKSRRNAEWRQRLKEPFDALASALEQAPGTDVGDTQSVAGVVRQFASLLFNSIDTISGLLFEYSPELQTDRERILEEAYDSEIFDAFVAVLGLAYPFGSLAGKLRDLAVPGSRSRPTGRS
jgi:hypothetical protein